jgi:hypothetical protein
MNNNTDNGEWNLLFLKKTVCVCICICELWDPGWFTVGLTVRLLCLLSAFFPFRISAQLTPAHYTTQKEKKNQEDVVHSLRFLF